MGGGGGGGDKHLGAGPAGQRKGLGLVAMATELVVPGSLRARECIFICSEHELHELNRFRQIPQATLLPSGRGSFACRGVSVGLCLCRNEGGGNKIRY